MLRSLSKNNKSFNKNVVNRNIKISNSFYAFKKINKNFNKNNIDNNDNKKIINNSCFLINDYKNISSTSRKIILKMIFVKKY